MIIDRRHRPWLAGSLVASAFAVSVALMAPRSGGPRLLLGGAAAAMVLICASRGLRNRLLPARIGSAASWLRQHLWLGMLSLVFALAHAGFRLGGPLTTGLVLVLGAAVLSGILGVVLQRVLTREINSLSSDAIFDLERGALSLRRRAYEIAWAACGAPPDAGDEAEQVRKRAGAPRAPATLLAAGTLAGQQEFARFYRDLVLPFLRALGGGPSPLATGADAALVFDALEAQVAEPLQPALRELRDRCGLLRTAARQHRLHRWLNGWLLLHVPLSMALVVLLIVHAVMALRY